MKNVFIWIVILALVAYIVYAAVHRKAVAPEAANPTADIPTLGTQADKQTDTQATQTNPQASTPISNNKTITTKDGMNIQITKEGTGPAVAAGQTAVVTYTGKLTNGTVFDASSKHGGEPFSFTVGGGQVIKGWDEGVAGMKVGETRILTIPPELAYGPNGIPGVIPPSATLVFEVSLVAIK